MSTFKETVPMFGEDEDELEYLERSRRAYYARLERDQKEQQQDKQEQNEQEPQQVTITVAEYTRLKAIEAKWLAVCALTKSE